MIRTNLVLALLGSEREMSTNTYGFPLIDNAQMMLPRYVERCNGDEEGRCRDMRWRVLLPTTIAEAMLDRFQLIDK
jgi:hypothetical protein